MTDDDVRKIVAGAVAETLIKLGLDTSDPTELQADMLHLRRWRKSVEAASRQTILTTLAVLTTGILGLIWMAVTRGGN